MPLERVNRPSPDRKMPHKSKRGT